jgi:hypothetical protein
VDVRKELYIGGRWEQPAGDGDITSLQLPAGA